jgi:hypothetical protein
MPICSQVQAFVERVIARFAARRLKVASSTLYRHLPGGRGALMEEGLS